MEEAAQNAEPEASSDFDGTYKLWGEIKTGSRSVVYHAEQHKLGQEVAIKVLRERVVEDPLLREAFNEELRALSALEHPNLVSINGFGIVGDAPYIAMELLEGDTLAERMASGPLDPKLAEQLILEMLKALAHMHVRGVVHRNLTPSAVFLQRDGEGVKLKLIDYGLTSRPASHTAAGAPRALALAYLAPEHAAGEDVDARADVYSAAAIIMEMMSGDMMHSAGRERTSIEMLQSQQVLTTATPPFHAFISRALDPAKVERFRNGDQMLRALMQLPTPWFERIQLQTEEAPVIEAVKQDGTSEFPFIAEPEPYESPVPPALPPRKRAKTSRKLMAALALVSLGAAGVKVWEHLQPPPSYEDTRLAHAAGEPMPPPEAADEAADEAAAAANSPLANPSPGQLGLARGAGPLREQETGREGPWADTPEPEQNPEERGLGPFERAQAAAATARGSLTDTARGQEPGVGARAVEPTALAERGLRPAANGTDRSAPLAAASPELGDAHTATTDLARGAAAPRDSANGRGQHAAADLARGVNEAANNERVGAADNAAEPVAGPGTLSAAEAARGFGAHTAAEPAPVSPQLAAAELLQRINTHATEASAARGLPAFPSPLARDPGDGPAIQPPLSAALAQDSGEAQGIRPPLAGEPNADSAAEEAQPVAAAAKAPTRGSKLNARGDVWPPPPDFVPQQRDWPPPASQKPTKRLHTDWPPPREEPVPQAAATGDGAAPHASVKVNGSVRHVPPSGQDIRELLKLMHRGEPPRGKAHDPWDGLLPKELEELRESIAKGEPGTAQQVLALRNFCRANPRVTHGHLLLAGLYKNRGWNLDALDQYELAYRKDPTARGAPEMLADTLQMVMDGMADADAARFIVRSYQREALPAIDYALRDKGMAPEASARLKQLRARIASAIR